MLGKRVSGKTLGLVGFGRIARAVARRACFGFDMPILVLTPRPVEVDILERIGARQVASLEQLLGESDFVSIHCPSTQATRHLIDASALASMKPSAILVNTARGDIVDESALADALIDQ